MQADQKLPKLVPLGLRDGKLRQKGEAATVQADLEVSPAGPKLISRATSSQRVKRPEVKAARCGKSTYREQPKSR